MRKIKICLLILFILFCSSQRIYASDWDQINRWLVMLLNDETEPFFPNTITAEFLRLGVRKTSTVCRTSEFKFICEVAPDTAADPGQIRKPAFIDSFRTIINYTAVWSKDSSYALPQIGSRDVARKSIYTDSEMRYWYVSRKAVMEPNIYVYPAPADTDTVIIFGYGIPEAGAANEPRYMNPAYDHLVVFYGLYLCYLRHGEGEIARYIKSIYESLLQDMFVITEGRQVDATIKKKVIPQ